MDFYDLLLQKDVNELHAQLDRLQLEHDTTHWDLAKVKELAAENIELKFRVGLLVRLLIAKGVITAEEFATLLAGRGQEPGGVKTASPPATPP